MIHFNKHILEKQTTLKFHFTEGISYNDILLLIKTIKRIYPKCPPKVIAMLKEEEYLLYVVDQSHTHYGFCFGDSIVGEYAKLQTVKGESRDV